MLDAAKLALRKSCLTERRAKVTQVLKERGLDCLVAYGSGRHSFLAFNPAWWLSGLRQIGRDMALVLPVDGPPVLVVSPAWDLDRALRTCEIDVVATEPESFFPTLESTIKKMGLLGKRMAVAGGGQQPRRVSESWAALLQTTPIAADPWVSDIAKVRDEWSLACVREAVWIAEEGYRRAINIARPGLPEFRVAAETEMFMRELGAEDNFLLMSASQHNLAVHRPTDRTIEAGDLLLSEITPSVCGEFIQICRTASIGAPSALQLEKFALLDTALRGSFPAARPGAKAKEVVQKMNEPIVAAGYEKYAKPPYMRTRGHSMALGSMDPEIAPDSDQILAAGMVFVLHPNQYVPETGYMMCGEPVLVTDKGAQPLTMNMGRLDTIDY